jgi:hypothetical protein
MMAQKFKSAFILIFTGLWLLVISALLTLAVNQARSLINLYAASAAPQPAIGASNLRLGGGNEALILGVVAVVLFLLVFRRPHRLLPVSIIAALIFFALNLYSGRHILPQLLIWPSPISLSEQYVQALAANDLDAALRLTDESDECVTITRQVFQDHRSQLEPGIDADRSEPVIQDTAVMSIRTFYEKPVPERLVTMQPVPQQGVTIMAKIERGSSLWLNLRMSYTPYLGTRYICGGEGN